MTAEQIKKSHALNIGHSSALQNESINMAMLSLYVMRILKLFRNSSVYHHNGRFVYWTTEVFQKSMSENQLGLSDSLFNPIKVADLKGINTKVLSWLTYYSQVIIHWVQVDRPKP